MRLSALARPLRAGSHLLLRAAILNLVLLTTTPAALPGQQRGYLLGISTPRIPEGTPDNRHPGKVLALLAVQRLVLDVAAEPRSSAYVESALEGTGVSRDDLHAMGLLRQEHSRDVIHFMLQTAEDQALVRSVAQRYAADLADSYAARWPAFDALFRDYRLETVDPGAVAFILVGCFSLDWDGLDLTVELGFRTDEHAVWAWENYPGSWQGKKGLYRGSHNTAVDSVWFTTFGDQWIRRRHGLPDLLWRIGSRVTLDSVSAPEGMKPAFERALRRSPDSVPLQLGRVMLALRRDGSTAEQIAESTGIPLEQVTDLLAALTVLEYADAMSGVYHAVVPVFGPEDRPLVQQVLALSREILRPWLAANLPRMESELAETTPLRYDVPFREMVYDVWHEVFGTVNKYLVEAGLFADPYDAGRTYRGFIPAVWHAEVQAPG